MQEMRTVLGVAERLAERGEDGVLATVVKVEGSTYRRPGARLLASRSGDWVGGISGGCLEGDLVRKAWWRTEGGPALVTYDSTADDETAWQFGLGCNGVVHVLLERVAKQGQDPLAFVRRCWRRREAGAVATVFRTSAPGVPLGERLTLDLDGRDTGDLGTDELADQVRADLAECLTVDRSRTKDYSLPTGEVEVFLEVVRPPIQLVVFGAGFDAIPVVQTAKSLGWHVVVVDRRTSLSSRPGFALADERLVVSAGEACTRLRLDDRTAAVVMNHNLSDDRIATASLLPTPVRYVGVLGPRARTEKILAEVATGQRPHPEQLARLYGPVGLDIGADTPEEIATAVIGQIVAVFAGRSGGHLSDRSGPIHQREPVRFEVTP